MSQYGDFLYDAENGLIKAEYALTQIHAFHMCPNEYNDKIFDLLNRVLKVKQEIEKLSTPEMEKMIEAEMEKTMKSVNDYCEAW